MIRSYESMTEKIRACGKSVMSIAVAQDRDLLEAVASAARIADMEPVLYGDETAIRSLLADIAPDAAYRIVNEPDEAAATRAAVRAVHDGEAHVLMKGMVNTSDFMKAVLDKEIGLRSGRVLSHLAAFEVPNMDRLIFVTDGGINIAPGLAEKKEILQNALYALHALGYRCPNVAVLAANEQVNPKAPATVDAAEIVRAWEAGEFETDCIVEGPIALDVALSRDAAEHKGIASRIAGETDLFLTSTIEVGNVLGKSMANIAGARMSGVVLGATAPIVLTSRAEDHVSKQNSILLALGCVA